MTGYSEEVHSVTIHDQAPGAIRVLGAEEGQMHEAWALDELFPDQPPTDTSLAQNPDAAYRMIKELIIGKEKDPEKAAEILENPGVMDNFGQNYMGVIWGLICKLPLEIKIKLTKNPSVQKSLSQFGIPAHVMTATLANWRREHNPAKFRADLAALNAHRDAHAAADAQRGETPLQPPRL